MLTALLAPRKSRTAKPLVEEIGMSIAIGTNKQKKKKRKKKSRIFGMLYVFREKGYSK